MPGDPLPEGYVPPSQNEPGSTSGTSGSGVGSTIVSIFKIFFDFATLKDAIINSLGAMFTEGLGSLAGTNSAPMLALGSELSQIFFQTERLRELRHTVWGQMYKVALAMLPLTFILTIAAAMKDGLYSVTGYSNTGEAVIDFVYSLALATTSYWLMDQTILLTHAMTLAIAEAMEVSITGNILAGAVIKSISFAGVSPVIILFVAIFAFLFVLTYIFSIVLAFLAREVVLIAVVALAPLLIILGAARPLRWLQALWVKAFVVFLLLLPVNVLVIAISVKLQVLAADISSGFGGTLLSILLMVGMGSVLMGLNITVGKIVYGVAIEVAQKAGSAVASAVGIAAGVAGAAALPALGGATGVGAGAAAGPGAAQSIGGGAAMGTQGASLAAEGVPELSAQIGRMLSQTRNPLTRGAGMGLQAGSLAQQAGLMGRSGGSSERGLPSFDMSGGIPGRDAALNDMKTHFSSELDAAAIGAPRDQIYSRLDEGAQWADDTISAAQLDGLPGGQMMQDLGYYRPGVNSMDEAGAAFVRAEAGRFALGDRSQWRPMPQSLGTPRGAGLKAGDYRAAMEIAQARGGEFSSPDDIRMIARGVSMQRQMGSQYDTIIAGANSYEKLGQWMEVTQNSYPLSDLSIHIEGYSA